MGRDVSNGLNLSREIIHWWNLPEFLCTIFFFNILLSLFCLNFTRRVVKGNCQW